MIVALNETVLYNGKMYHPDPQGLCEVPEEVAIALGLVAPPTIDSKAEPAEVQEVPKRRRGVASAVPNGEGNDATDDA